MSYQSPVVMECVQKNIPGDTEKDSLYDMVEVRRPPTADGEPGELLAACMMSDDQGLEGIADALAAKRLWREANRFRAMVSSSKRRPT
jgi:hypothetical protein